jgi:hypothetical protein
MKRKAATDDWGCLLVRAENPPLPRPGVYRLTHIATGRCYVGATLNIRRRFLEHSWGNGNVQQIDELAAPGAFLAEPLFYTLGTLFRSKRQAGLVEAEERLIEACDGYAGFNRPHADVATLARHPDALEKARATHKRPEVKAAKSARMQALHADPGFRAKHLSASRKANSSPERNAKIARSMAGNRNRRSFLERT